jgi:integrase
VGKILTEAAIARALRDIKKGDKGAIILTDPAPRGSGRLVLKVRPGVAEWYVQRYVDGRRRMAKIGTYPALPLAAARRAFEAGPALRPVPAAGGASLRAMFDAFLASRTMVKPGTLRIMRCVFDDACRVIGGDRPAGEVTPADIVAVIRPVYARGAPVYADKYRSHMGTAFRWAMRAANDYRAADRVDWGVRSNPVDSIARDREAAGRTGKRWLRLAEYLDYLAHMDDPRAAWEPLRRAIQLVMLTGQRSEEILRLRPECWDSEARLLTWEETKNGRAHVLPVCDRAAAILDGLRPGRGGWFFPNSGGPAIPIRAHSLMAVHNRYTKARQCERFTSRDLRRTWKTLAGEAGLSKEDRDRLQNHARGDVSSVHYDRYEYLREKRAAVAAWGDWLEARIAERARA